MVYEHEWFKVGAVKSECDFANSTLTSTHLHSYISDHRIITTFNDLLNIDISTNDDATVDSMFLSSTGRTVGIDNVADEFQEFRELLMSTNVIFNFEIIFIDDDLESVKYVINNDGVFSIRGELAFQGELEKHN